MLMDLFYDALPPGVHKTRIHFHDFMLSVHRRLRTLNNVADPLLAVAEEFTRKNQAGGGHLVLCLDEFMVRRMRVRGTGHARLSCLPLAAGDGRRGRHDPQAPLPASL
jgi:hypothetical protein